MKPEPVWKRILKALELGAMTIDELARCLCVSIGAVYKATCELRWNGRIHGQWEPSKTHARSVLRYSL